MPRVVCTLSLPKELLALLDPLKPEARAEPVRAGLLAAALHWSTQILKVHFTRAAYNLWRDAYPWRGAKYEKAKQKKYGHRDPMVLTGAFRASILGRVPIFKTQTEGKRATVTITLPYGPAANFHTGKGRYDFKKSLTAMNRTDLRVLSEVADAATQTALRAQLAAGGAPAMKTWAA